MHFISHENLLQIFNSYVAVAKKTMILISNCNAYDLSHKTQEKNSWKKKDMQWRFYSYLIYKYLKYSF